MRNETDAFLSLKLMHHLVVLPLTKQLTNLCGNIWMRSLRSARAERVEYLLLHEFHNKDYIVPEKYSSKARQERDANVARLLGNKQGNAFSLDLYMSSLWIMAHGIYSIWIIVKATNGKRRGKPAYSGGLVLEPKRGFYDKYVLLLDFNSLYPSIVQEYNICFTTTDVCPPPPLRYIIESIGSCIVWMLV